MSVTRQTESIEEVKSYSETVEKLKQEGRTFTKEQVSFLQYTEKYPAEVPHLMFLQGVNSNSFIVMAEIHKAVRAQKKVYFETDGSFNMSRYWLAD